MSTPQSDKPVKVSRLHGPLRWWRGHRYTTVLLEVLDPLPGEPATVRALALRSPRGRVCVLTHAWTPYEHMRHPPTN